MKRNLIVAAFLVLIVAILLYASSKASHSRMAGGQTAPDFALQDIDGHMVRLSDLRGKAVVLNFWATWCPPCKAEIPWFIDLQNKYGPRGLQIVGVSMDDGGMAAVVPFARKIGINYKVVLGNSDVSDLYGGVYSLPTTFYIGRDGRVLEYVPGLITHYEIERNIKAALASETLKQSAGN